MRKIAARIYNLIWNVNECPIYIRWSSQPPSTPMQHIHRYASRHLFQPHPFALRAILKLILLFLWPFRALLLIYRYSRKFGPEIRQDTGKSLITQALEQIWFALRYSIPPVGYYQYEFYRNQTPLFIEQHLFQREASSLFHSLNGYKQHKAIDDKHAFQLLCRQHNLPSIATLNLFHQGQPLLSLDSWPATGPERSLFVKPTQGSRGEGAVLWEYLAHGYYQNQAGMKLSWPDLLTHLKMRSLERAYLLQPCLSNHADIAALSPNALITIRLVTGRTPADDVIPIAATLKMPRHQQAITNTHGLNSAIHLETGVLGKAYTYRPVCPGYDTHPITKAAITGRPLPEWSEALNLAKQAHLLFPDFIFLGWDIALTDEGLVLLEANVGWDVLTVQKPQRTPLGATRFADICIMWLHGPSRRRKGNPAPPLPPVIAKLLKFIIKTSDSFFLSKLF